MVFASAQIILATAKILLIIAEKKLARPLLDPAAQVSFNITYE